MNPDLDLEITRVIRASRADVWRAWTERDQLQQWFIPAPMVLRVDQLDPRPGGALVTSFSEDGETFGPHIDAVFLAVEDETLLVWTNAVDSRWRPQHPQPVALTTEVRLADHPDGTTYRIVARHGTPEDCERHLALGFVEGWGVVIDQLAAHVEQPDLG